jgi:hypothetical protein
MSVQWRNFRLAKGNVEKSTAYGAAGAAIARKDDRALFGL